jgi:hypothetical protein
MGMKRLSLIRVGYLLFIAALAGFCAGWLPLGNGDLRPYAVALTWATIVAGLSHARPRLALGHALLIFNATYWACFLCLPESQWSLTAKLQHLKALLLGALVLLELGTAAMLVRAYLRGRNQQKLFPTEAFLQALQQFPMPDAMTQVFSMEFNIWAAVASHFWRRPLFSPGTYTGVARLDTGYTRPLVGIACAAGAAVVVLSVWFLPAYWPVLPVLAIAYLALLLHCDVMAFRADAVFVGQGAMVISNGVHGMLRVPLADIAAIHRRSPGESPVANDLQQWHGSLKVSRLEPPNLQLLLRKPIAILGQTYSGILLSCSDATALQSLIPAALPPSSPDAPRARR